MAKPRGDLGALVVPKAAAAAAVPHAAAPAPAVAPAPAPVIPAATPSPTDAGAPKALTVKLDGPTYRRLRQFCRAQEDATGKAPTHQQVMVAALLAFLPTE